MKKKGIMCIIAILMTSLCIAQDTYHNPESVVYDPLGDCYYVSNYGNYTIVKSDITGIIDTLATNMNECLGMHILNNVLYVSCLRYVKGFDLSTDSLTFSQLLPATNWLDGMTSDADGNLYVVDTSGKIFKLNPTTGDYHVFATGLPNYTQDVVYDIHNNRLLAVAWQYHSPIYAIDADDSTSITEYSTTSGYFDGITIDVQGNVYVASHAGSDHVYKFDNTLSNPPTEIPGNFNEPAGLNYNIVEDILAVPNFEGNTVDFIDLSSAIDEPGHPQGCITFYGSIPNPAHSNSCMKFSLQHNTHVLLKIYNVKGELVDTPISGAFESGSHAVSWDNNSLEPGVYFCTISSGDFSATRKLTLVR